MKKFNLIIALLLFVGASVFADSMVDIGVQATVKAEAKLELAYDLDTEDFNIVNTNTLDVKITIVGDQMVAKGEGAPVGFIEVSGIKAIIGSDDTIKVAPILDDNKAITADGLVRIQDTDEDGDLDKDDLVEVPKAILLPTVKAQVNILGPALYVQVTNADNKIDLDVFKDHAIFKAFDYPGDGTGDGFPDAAASAIATVAAIAADPDAVPVIVPTKEKVSATTRLSTDLDQDAGGSGGFALGTINGIVDAAVILRDDDDGDNNSLNVGATFDVAVLKDIGLSIKGAFLFDPAVAADDIDTLGYGLALGWKLDFDDTGSHLKIEGAFEGKTTLGDAGATEGEISAHLGLNIAGLTVDGYYATNIGVEPAAHDIKAQVSTGTLLSFLKLTGDLELGLKGDDALLLGIGADFDLTLLDFMTPYANFKFMSHTAPVSKVDLRAGIKFNIIDNVSLDLFWGGRIADDAGDKKGKIGLTTVVKL